MFLVTLSADVAAATVELQTCAAALLLFTAGQHVDVHGSGRKVLDHHTLVRTVVFVGPVDAARVPVRPEDVLPIKCHGERVHGGADDDLTIRPAQGTTLDLLPENIKHP